MTPNPSRNLVVITGGPGAGKTTLIDALAARGHAVMQEAGRAVIRSELGSGGTGLPWQDPIRFAELMMAADLRSYEAALLMKPPVFFDRGLPDVAGYLQLCGLDVPSVLTEAIARRRYRETVFIAPHWPEIYRRDAERRQGPEEARRTSAMMARIYTLHGYRLVALPLAPVTERVAFVETALAAST